MKKPRTDAYNFFGESSWFSHELKPHINLLMSLYRGSSRVARGRWPYGGGALTMAPPPAKHEQEQDGIIKKRGVLNSTILFLWQLRHAAK